MSSPKKGWGLAPTWARAMNPPVWAGVKPVVFISIHACGHMFYTEPDVVYDAINSRLVMQFSRPSDSRYTALYRVRLPCRLCVREPV